MREILFRGKSECGGEWLNGHYCIYRGCPQLLTDDYVWESVDEKTVGQYTGLIDKNGKKIFEGDIVKYTEFYKFIDDELETAEEKNESISIVKFVDGKFTPLPTRYCCEDYWYSWACDNFEVIGNIHDNPELLNN